METWKTKISEILMNNPQGLSINEITLLAKTTRHTASIALAELKGEGKIIIRQVGMAKLHYWGGII